MNDGGSGLRVRDLALDPPLIVSADTNLHDVAVGMLRRRTAAALVAQTGAIVTERDLVRALAAGTEAVIQAGEIATVAPYSIGLNAAVEEAIALMVRVRHRTLLVVDELTRPRGFVTLLDVAAGLLGPVETPAWLSRLRLALHVDVAEEAQPASRPPL